MWYFILAIVGYLLFNFLWDLNKDSHDLQSTSVNKKFGVVAQAINNVAYNGMGEIVPLDKRSFNLYKTGSNQIVNFQYSTGHLTITWKYKYFQKEVVHEKQYNDVRNLSIFEQQAIAEEMINEMFFVVENHKRNVLNT